ncbi:MAG: hypothetical protein IKX37_04720 [Bacteroidales bacterium]|nr:hypothetical protein [Bacteroidales bacterium]
MRSYRDIQNLDQLNAAIHQSGKVVAAKEKQLKKRYEKARAFYTPGTLVAEGGRRLVSKLPLTDIALLLIRKLRQIL